MKKILSHAILFSLISLPLLASAQAFGLQNPIGVNSISELIVIVVKVIRYIAIPFVVIMIMYAGYLFLYDAAMHKGGGDQKTAKDTLWWVVVGAFVILSAEMIAIVISNTLNSVR